MAEPMISTPLEDTVVIVGVGLIGGSLAAALKQRNLVRHIIGVGRDRVRIEAARSAGLIDEAATNIAEVISRANLAVFCTPVGQVAADVRMAENAIASAGVHLTEPQLFTDVGSVKRPICDSLVDISKFIGSHPIAGSHRQGFEAADAQLFNGRVCVVTPVANSVHSQLERLERLWQSVGMQTIRLSPDAHDVSLAMTSHLPHLVAAALAMTLTEQNKPLTGSGFRDTTRVAAGGSDLWTDILVNNADQVIAGIDAMQQTLNSFRDALKIRNPERLRELLLAGQKIRASLDQKPTASDQNRLELSE